MSETATATSETARPPLTRERVVSAGLRLIDEDGLGNLSMRRLGAELGVEAMSLYNHVANKGDLLDGIVERLWEEIAARTETSGDWRGDVLSLADAVRGVGHDHPDAYLLMFDRWVLPDSAIGVGSDLIGSLRGAGFGDEVEEAVRAIIGYVTGYTLSEIAWYGDPEAAPEAGLAGGPRSGGSPPDERRSEAQRVFVECDTEAQFTFGLQVLLDGLEVRRGDAR